MNSLETDTIAAIATPMGPGGIGIIRLSGPDALPIARTHFIRRKKSDNAPESPDTPLFESHRFYLGFLMDPGNGDRLDEVFVVFMAAPKTYTGEDIVEIHAHAGPFVLQKALDSIIRAGARLAEPGEFTRRAFLNGKIDLTQAEAVIDIIHARNRNALTFAMDHLRGGAGDVLRSIRDQLIDILSEIEARIDFIEDVDSDLHVALIERSLKDLYRSITAIARRHVQKRLFSGESRIVIAGPPNVGKSTLMNLLLDQTRAIVSDHPGTTRDLITETFILCGIPFVLCDTAGIHATENPVEQMGIEKTLAEIKSADLVLYLVDARRELEDSDRSIIHGHAPECMVVRNKIDLVQDSLQPFEGKGGSLKTVDISALKGYGMEALRNSIIGHFRAEPGGVSSEMTPTLRQKQLLDKAGEMLLSGLNCIKKGGAAPDLLAIDVQGALECMQDILGESRNMDIIHAVFEKFCIGK